MGVIVVNLLIAIMLLIAALSISWIAFRERKQYSG
ncbi:hypothetical protein CLV27_1377 [Phorcysia thermohydrogeniphila]|uniref:Uncharacterized protein n=1 Tax=Phorcysia thermohydrogeniphila TaxID=936138 RepID=A0A4V2PD04_9BACT|nr:hypothetical protein CLV27_1377 [Phorcysia thermohydrogeniphila]